MIVFNLAPKIVRTCTPSANAIPNLIGLYANEGGTVTAVNTAGEAVTIVLAASQPWVGQLLKVTAWSGTAGSLLQYQER